MARMATFTHGTAHATDRSAAREEAGAAPDHGFWLFMAGVPLTIILTLLAVAWISLTSL